MFKKLSNKLKKGILSTMCILAGIISISVVVYTAYILESDFESKSIQFIKQYSSCIEMRWETIRKLPYLIDKKTVLAGINEKNYISLQSVLNQLVMSNSNLGSAAIIFDGMICKSNYFGYETILNENFGGIEEFEKALKSKKDLNSIIVIKSDEKLYRILCVYPIIDNDSIRGAYLLDIDVNKPNTLFADSSLENNYYLKDSNIYLFDAKNNIAVVKKTNNQVLEQNKIMKAIEKNSAQKINGRLYQSIYIEEQELGLVYSIPLISVYKQDVTFALGIGLITFFVIMIGLMLTKRFVNKVISRLNSLDRMDIYVSNRERNEKKHD